MKRWRQAAVILVCGLGAVIALMARAATRVRVVGPSMEPALGDGDRVLVNRLAVLLRRPRVGEVVVARLPGVPGGLTVKRVAAECPGAEQGTGQSHYVLLGDNAPASTDSRHRGPVGRSALMGTVWYRYWPPQRRGRIRRGVEES